MRSLAGFHPSPSFHWLSDHLPPNHVWILLLLSQASGSHLWLSSQTCLILLMLLNWSSFALDPVVLLCPTTLSLSIVPTFLCCIHPYIWPFSHSSGPCTAALVQMDTDRSTQAHPMNLVLPPPDFETLVNLLKLSQLQFPHLQNGDNNSYLKKWTITCEVHLTHLAHS